MASSFTDNGRLIERRAKFSTYVHMRLLHGTKIEVDLAAGTPARLWFGDTAAGSLDLECSEIARELADICNQAADFMDTQERRSNRDAPRPQ